MSEHDGAYQVALEPGRYSVFVEHGGSPYCAEETKSDRCAITVLPGTPTIYDPFIDAAGY